MRTMIDSQCRRPKRDLAELRAAIAQTSARVRTTTRTGSHREHASLQVGVIDPTAVAACTAVEYISPERKPKIGLRRRRIDVDNGPDGLGSTAANVPFRL